MQDTPGTERGGSVARSSNTVEPDDGSDVRNLYARLAHTISKHQLPRLSSLGLGVEGMYTCLQGHYCTTSTSSLGRRFLLRPQRQS